MSENRNTINWYPGHMEKAKRQMLERLKAVDMVIEVPMQEFRMPVQIRCCYPWYRINQGSSFFPNVIWRTLL